MALKKEIDAGLDAAAKQVTVEFFREKIGAKDLKELAVVLKLRPAVGEVKLADVVNGLAKQPKVTRVRKTKKAARKKSDEIVTTTDEGRARYDARVLMSINRLVKKTEEPVGAEAIREEAGGTASQFRAAAMRLIKAKKIKRSGKARGTVYQPR